MCPGASQPSSASSNDLLLQWSNPKYWQRLCPYLTVAGSGGALSNEGSSSNDEGADGNTKELLLERLIEDGYALIDSDMGAGKGGGGGPRVKVGRGISEMETRHLLPATFVLLFDETWELAAESHAILLRNGDLDGDNGCASDGRGQPKKKQTNKGVLNPHGMAFNFDVLAWHIDPRKDQAGFSPHRDRQPDTLCALKRSFYDDGQAKYVTHWIALEDATPENSCLYVIPKEFDPGYLNGDDPPDSQEEEGDDKLSSGSNSGESNDEQFSDPLTRALGTKQSYQNIRALPRSAGQSLIFTHRILHWGSRGNPRALNVRPRVAISFVYSDVEFEAPYLSNNSFSPSAGDDQNDKLCWTAPPFSIRLLLVCAQLLIYYQRFNLSTQMIRACYDYCKSNSEELHESYRKKVFVEYVKAMKERRDGTDEDGNTVVCKNNVSSDSVESDAGANSEDEEALLEEMLNASDEFDDDYDDMVCNDVPESANRRKRKHDGY